MKIEILCICYNSEKFIKQVIENWRRVGQVFIYIDNKTNDRTKEIVRKLGIVPKFFDFVDFATSRNEILEKHNDKETYRIFLDDSYLLIGDPRSLIRELSRRRDNVISIKITKDHEFFTYSKITKFPVIYEGSVHEYINEPPTYQIESVYIRELTCKEHIERTLKRIPRDYDVMLGLWYKNPQNYRNVYYICRSLLLFLNYKQYVPYKMTKYWLIQLITMKGIKKNWARVQLSILNTIIVESGLEKDSIHEKEPIQ